VYQGFLCFSGVFGFFLEMFVVYELAKTIV